MVFIWIYKKMTSEIESQDTTQSMEKKGNMAKRFAINMLKWIRCLRSFICKKNTSETRGVLTKNVGNQCAFRTHIFCVKATNFDTNLHFF